MQSVCTLRAELRIQQKQRAVLRAWIRSNRPDVIKAMRDLFDIERSVNQLKRVIRCAEKAERRDLDKRQMLLFSVPSDITKVLILRVKTSSMSSHKQSKALLTLSHAYDYIIRNGNQ